METIDLTCASHTSCLPGKLRTTHAALGTILRRAKWIALKISFPVRLGTRCTVLEILWFDSTLYSTRWNQTINVLTLYDLIAQPQSDCSYVCVEKVAFVNGVWLGCWQLSIKSHLKAQMQVCLLATRLTRRKFVPSCLKPLPSAYGLW